MPESSKIIESARKWFARESGKDTLKILYGIRGAGKSAAVNAIIEDLRSGGTPEKNIVHIDFEEPAMRRVKTYKDVLALIKKREIEGKAYLFLDELTGLLDYEVLMGVLFGMKEFELMVTVSNRRIFESQVATYFKGRISRCMMPAPLGLKRDRRELQRVWGTLFLRDVLGGHLLADATAEERLAEVLSDRLGEQLSMRRLAQLLDINGHKLHPNTVADYIKALLDACLIEAAPICDTFTGEVLNIGMRYFWTDLELRASRFGDSPDFETERLKYAQKYLEIRRTHAKVMCVRTNDLFADFVVTDRDGKMEEIKWKEF